MLIKIIVLWFVVTGVVIAFYARRELYAMWMEPMLRHPVMIIESDDWGAGPAGQAEALNSLANILTQFTDSGGRHPVMTLGMVLATANGEKIKETGNYQRELISETTHGPLLEAIRAGVDKAVFSLHLHGLEHYWPTALMIASEYDESVRTWIYSAPGTSTEDLPSSLQSRWIDATELPSRSLGVADVRQAVHEEVDAFKHIFGVLPHVVVPPTFIWNGLVEKAWSDEGVAVIVTPGRRFEVRDERGNPAGSGCKIYNGQPGEGGIIYLVRDNFYEPSLGHTLADALNELVVKTRLARPALFETHRFNFLGEEEKKLHSLDGLEELLSSALSKFPDLAFLSAEKLAEVLQKRDPEWVYTSFRCKIHVWIERLRMVSRLRKLVWVSGWILPAWLLWVFTYTART